MKGNRKADAERLVDTWIERLRKSDTPMGSVPDYLRSSEEEEQMTPDQAESFRAALIGFRRTASALSEDDERELQETGDTKFLFPLGEVLNALPAKYVLDANITPEDRQRKVEIIIENLVDQLTSGEVRISVSRLVYGVPAGIIQSEAFRDDITMIALPLPSVVSAIDPASLARWTAKKKVKYDMDDLPDPFDFEQGGRAAESDAAASAPAPETPAGAEVPPHGPAERSAADGSEPEEWETVTDWLCGVNLNAATAEQLMSLEGVTPRIASAVLAYRSENGPFRSIFSLQNVPGVGRKTFKKITGMPYSRTGRHRRLILSRLLGLRASDVSHLPTVVEAIASRPECQGCLISDMDGLVLAESDAEDRAAALAAIVPRMSKQLAENMAEIGGGCLQSFSVCLDGRMYTVVPGRQTYLTALHGANRLTAKHLRLLQKAARELDWLLSKRGYVSLEPAGLSTRFHKYGDV